MKWIIDNWSFLVIVLACIIVAVHYYKKFNELPSEQQLIKIKEWLLAIVIEAEKIYGNQTGKIKLSYTYSCFVKAFPALANVISFDLFSSLVDEVLAEMRNILENNSNAKAYVEEK